MPTPGKTGQDTRPYNLLKLALCLSLFLVISCSLPLSSFAHAEDIPLRHLDRTTPPSSVPYPTDHSLELHQTEARYEQAIHYQPSTASQDSHTLQNTVAAYQRIISHLQGELAALDKRIAEHNQMGQEVRAQCNAIRPSTPFANWCLEESRWHNQLTDELNQELSALMAQYQDKQHDLQTIQVQRFGTSRGQHIHTVHYQQKASSWVPQQQAEKIHLHFKTPTLQESAP